MDSLSIEELKKLKIWIANKKEEAEITIWEKKREDRAKRALKE